MFVSVRNVVGEMGVIAQRNPGDSGRVRDNMAVKCVEYTILVYVSGVADADRVWTGNDIDEATRKLTELRYRFPTAAVRFSVSTYFHAVSPIMPCSAPPSARRADMDSLAAGG